MPLTLDDNNADFQIRGFQSRVFKSTRHDNQDQIYTHSIIITPREYSSLIGHPRSLAELTAAHLQKISELKPTIS